MPAALCAAAMLLTPASAQVMNEYAVRAAYLSKLIPFIDWPVNAFDSPSAPITICILGQDPFGQEIDKDVTSNAPQGRHVQVRRIATPDVATADATKGCSVVYTSDPDTGLDPIAALQGKPVLTVTEAGMRIHGIISFLTIDNHVRFDIDDAAAAKGGLRISSKLLELAHTVTHRQGAQ